MSKTMRTEHEGQDDDSYRDDGPGRIKDLNSNRIGSVSYRGKKTQDHREHCNLCVRMRSH